MPRHPSESPPLWPLVPTYPSNLFAGTAECYSRYRVPYPEALLGDLSERARLRGTGHLLDLACGTGEVALALHSLFTDVWAVDQEPEMIEQAVRNAHGRGAQNLRWIVGRAEDVEAPDQHFQLVSVGNALHRLNRPLLAARALKWLERGRCFAVLGSNSVWTGKEEWQTLAVEVIRKWLPRRKTSEGAADAQPGQTHQQVVTAAGFVDVATYNFPTPHVWTLDSFVGYLYSTSVASRAALGDAIVGFEKDIRRTLLAYDSGGEYPETMDFFYILGTAP